MSTSSASRRIAVLAAGGLGVATVVGLVGGASGAGPASGCRASVARVSGLPAPLPPTVEPIVADDCRGEDAGVVNPTRAVGPLDLRVLYASTHPTSPNAEAGVADVSVNLSTIDSRLPDIGVQVLTSEASVTCVNGAPALSGRSRVVGLSVNGVDQLVIPPGDASTTIAADPLVNIKLNEQVKSGTTITQRALHIHALTGILDLDVVVAESLAGYTGNPCVQPTTPPPTSPPGQAVGWMNGGGQLPGDVTHSLVLPCTKTQRHPGPQLKVETPNGRFTLKSLSTVSCSTVVGNGDPEQPDAGFNTLSGTAVGSCNGHSGVDASFTFTDGGEPNKGNDKATVTIDKDSRYGCHVSITGVTVNGNQQAHRGAGPPA